jgi:hypothetical protein
MSTPANRQRHLDAPTPAPRRCHHAADPLTRPDCQLTAAIRYRPIALCPSCDQRRSTLGKGQAGQPLPAIPNIDIAHWINQAHQDLHTAEATLRATVTRARTQGLPWSAIGDLLGISRQAAQQRFRTTRPPKPPGLTPQRL